MQYITHLKIDDIIFPGQLTSKNIFEATCASFEQSPSFCLYLNNKFQTFNSMNKYENKKRIELKWLLFINIVVLFTLLSLAGLSLYYIY